MGGYIRTARTATTTLANGDNVMVAAAAIAADEEMYLQAIYLERTDTAADVTVIIKNTAGTPVEVLPRIKLNSDKGAMWLEFTPLDDRMRTRIRCGAGEGLTINASVGDKAAAWVQYTIGDAEGAL